MSGTSLASSSPVRFNGAFLEAKDEPESLAIEQEEEEGDENEEKQKRKAARKATKAALKAQHKAERKAVRQAKRDAKSKEAKDQESANVLFKYEYIYSNGLLEQENVGPLDPPRQTDGEQTKYEDLQKDGLAAWIMQLEKRCSDAVRFAKEATNYEAKRQAKIQARDAYLKDKSLGKPRKNFIIPPEIRKFRKVKASAEFNPKELRDSKYTIVQWHTQLYIALYNWKRYQDATARYRKLRQELVSASASEAARVRDQEVTNAMSGPLGAIQHEMTKYRTKSQTAFTEMAEIVTDTEYRTWCVLPVDRSESKEPLKQGLGPSEKLHSRQYSETDFPLFNTPTGAILYMSDRNNPVKSDKIFRSVIGVLFFGKTFDQILNEYDKEPTRYLTNYVLQNMVSVPIFRTLRLAALLSSRPRELFPQYISYMTGRLDLYNAMKQPRDKLDADRRLGSFALLSEQEQAAKVAEARLSLRRLTRILAPLGQALGLDHQVWLNRDLWQNFMTMARLYLTSDDKQVRDLEKESSEEATPGGFLLHRLVDIINTPFVSVHATQRALVNWIQGQETRQQQQLNKEVKQSIQDKQVGSSAVESTKGLVSDWNHGRDSLLFDIATVAVHVRLEYRIALFKTPLFPSVYFEPEAKQLTHKSRNLELRTRALILYVMGSEHPAADLPKFNDYVQEVVAPMNLLVQQGETLVLEKLLHILMEANRQPKAPVIPSAAYYIDYHLRDRFRKAVECCVSVAAELVDLSSSSSDTSSTRRRNYQQLLDRYQNIITMLVAFVYQRFKKTQIPEEWSRYHLEEENNKPFASILADNAETAGFKPFCNFITMALTEGMAAGDVGLFQYATCARLDYSWPDARTISTQTSPAWNITTGEQVDFSGAPTSRAIGKILLQTQDSQKLDSMAFAYRRSHGLVHKALFYEKRNLPILYHYLTETHELVQIERQESKLAELKLVQNIVNHSPGQYFADTITLDIDSKEQKQEPSSVRTSHHWLRQEPPSLEAITTLRLKNESDYATKYQLHAWNGIDLTRTFLSSPEASEMAVAILVQASETRDTRLLALLVEQVLFPMVTNVSQLAVPQALQAEIRAPWVNAFDSWSGPFKRAIQRSALCLEIILSVRHEDDLGNFTEFISSGVDAKERLVLQAETQDSSLSQEERDQRRRIRLDARAKDLIEREWTRTIDPPKDAATIIVGRLVSEQAEQANEMRRILNGLRQCSNRLLELTKAATSSSNIEPGNPSLLDPEETRLEPKEFKALQISKNATPALGHPDDLTLGQCAELVEVLCAHFRNLVVSINKAYSASTTNVIAPLEPTRSASALTLPSSSSLAVNLAQIMASALGISAQDNDDSQTGIDQVWKRLASDNWLACVQLVTDHAAAPFIFYHYGLHLKESDNKEIVDFRQEAALYVARIGEYARAETQYHVWWTLWGRQGRTPAGVIGDAVPYPALLDASSIVAWASNPTSGRGLGQGANTTDTVGFLEDFIKQCKYQVNVDALAQILQDLYQDKIDVKLQKILLEQFASGDVNVISSASALALWQLLFVDDDADAPATIRPGRGQDQAMDTSEDTDVKSSSTGPSIGDVSFLTPNGDIISKSATEASQLSEYTDWGTRLRQFFDMLGKQERAISSDRQLQSKVRFLKTNVNKWLQARPRLVSAMWTVNRLPFDTSPASTDWIGTIMLPFLNNNSSAALFPSIDQDPDRDPIVLYQLDKESHVGNGGTKLHWTDLLAQWIIAQDKKTIDTSGTINRGSRLVLAMAKAAAKNKSKYSNLFAVIIKSFNKRLEQSLEQNLKQGSEQQRQASSSSPTLLGLDSPNNIATDTTLMAEICELAQTSIGRGDHLASSPHLLAAMATNWWFWTSQMSEFHTSKQDKAIQAWTGLLKGYVIDFVVKRGRGGLLLSELIDRESRGVVKQVVSMLLRMSDDQLDLNLWKQHLDPKHTLLSVEQVRRIEHFAVHDEVESKIVSAEYLTSYPQTLAVLVNLATVYQPKPDDMEMSKWVKSFTLGKWFANERYNEFFHIMLADALEGSITSHSQLNDLKHRGVPSLKPLIQGRAAHVTPA